jgi:hypothetical protein
MGSVCDGLNGATMPLLKELEGIFAFVSINLPRLWRFGVKILRSVLSPLTSLLFHSWEVTVGN